MSAKEPNELDSYSLYIDGRDEAHPLTHDLDPDAEWLEQQQDAAYQAAVDAGMFDYPGDLLADCKSAAPDSIFGMMGNLKTLSDAILAGDGKSSDAAKAAVCAGYYESLGRGQA